MQTTIAVEAHSRAIRSTTRVAAACPSPRPPTSLPLTSPNRPALPIALIAARGKAPEASIFAASGAMISSETRSMLSSQVGVVAICRNPLGWSELTQLRNLMVMPLLLGIESEGGAMVHEKQTKNEESAAHLNQNTDTGTVPRA